jgi:hypothetical protein
MRLPDEMIEQGALDLRALGFDVDSNARPAPAAAETTPVLDALDAAIARAGGEPPPPEPEAPLGGDRTEQVAAAALRLAEEHGVTPAVPRPTPAQASAKFAARAAKHRSPPQPPKPKPPRSPQDDSREAISMMVEQCHVAREEGDDDQVVAALLPLLNAARHQGDDVVKALADAALKGSKPRLLASLEVAATVAARGADEVIGDGGVSTEEDAVVNVARACERLAFLDLADDATDALGTALAAAAHRRANHATLEIRGAIPAEENSVHAHATALGNALGAACAAAAVARACTVLGKERCAKAAEKPLQIGVDAGVDALERFAMMKSVETVSREPIANLTEADALLDECSFALQFGHRFQRFVEGALGEGETVTAALLKSLQTLEGLYIRLEDAYRDAGVREALEDMDDPLAALQDAFFVLRRGVDRAVGTLSEQAALAELHRTLATLALDADVFQAAASLATRGETKELSLVDAIDEEVRGASIESLAIAAGGAFACASSVAALKDEVVGELARSVPLAVPLLDDFDHASHQYDELAAGALSALFDEPGLMLSRRRFFADVVDDRVGQYSKLGDKDVLEEDDSRLENAYEKVLGHAALRAALNALPAGAPRLALCRKLAGDAANAILARCTSGDKVGALGALALRRDARKLFATLGGLLPSEESLGAGEVFRATLRPELEAATAALALLCVEAPSDVRTLRLSAAGVCRGDVRAALGMRRDFEENAIAAAVAAAAVVASEGLVRFAFCEPGSVVESQ